MNRDHSNTTIFFTVLLGFLLGNFLFLGGTPLALAQVDRSVLEGTVADTSGSVIAGAKVSVLAVETGLSEEQLSRSIRFRRHQARHRVEYLSCPWPLARTQVQPGYVIPIPLYLVSLD